MSEVLRELRESRVEEMALETNCITKRELTFIDSFERFGGMLHLEGLEMLSKNYLRKIPPQRRRYYFIVFLKFYYVFHLKIQSLNALIYILGLWKVPLCIRKDS